MGFPRRWRDTEGGILLPATPDRSEFEVFTRDLEGFAAIDVVVASGGVAEVGTDVVVVAVLGTVFFFSIRVSE